MNLTRSFTVEECACRCCGECRMSPIFMDALQSLRDQWGKPMVITSGYRCKVHNKEVGGAKGSKHLKGIAVDIAISSSEERYLLVALALKMGFGGIGVAESFVHLDTRPGKPALWTY